LKQNLFINIDGDGDNAIILIPEQQRICGAAKNVCMNENIANQINSWTADDVAFRAAATFCSEDKDDDGYLPEDAQIFNTMKRISTMYRNIYTDVGNGQHSIQTTLPSRHSL